jgi:hypothetical protein
MIIRTNDQGGYVYRGDTGSVLDFLFDQEDGVTARDLTGYHGWVSFWYPGAGVHLTRAGIVISEDGILRYLPRGDEFPALGDVRFQATISANDIGYGTNRGYFKLSHDVIRRRVVPRQ